MKQSTPKQFTTELCHIISGTKELKPKPKYSAISLLQMTIQDAMYNPKLIDLPIHLFSGDAGMGLERPTPVTVSYQRLWEYYVSMDILRETVGKDIAITKKYPTVEAHYSGIGFEKQVGRLELNH